MSDSITEQTFYTLTTLYGTIGSTEGTLYYGSGGALTDIRYDASWAGLSGSGLSFGLMQNDVATNATAQALYESLVDDAVTAGRISSSTGDTYIDLAEHDPGSLTDSQMDDISANILQPGAAQILGLDMQTLANVANAVDGAANAVQQEWDSAGVFDPSSSDYQTAIALAAAWKNMHGNITDLQDYLTGGDFSDEGLSTLTAAPTLADIENFLENQSFFLAHPDNFTNLLDNVDRGLGFWDGTGLPDLATGLNDLAGWAKKLAMGLLEPGVVVPAPFLVNLIGPEWGLALATGSPLVLDVSSGGTGISLTSEAVSTAAYWDIQADGFRHQSGWIGSGTGLLCIDLNSNGVIDNNSELFGNGLCAGM
jgi:hypothetical protein